MKSAIGYCDKCANALKCKICAFLCILAFAICYFVELWWFQDLKYTGFFGGVELNAAGHVMIVRTMAETIHVFWR